MYPSFSSSPFHLQYTHCTSHWYIVIHSLTAHSQYYVLVELTVGGILSWIYHPHKRIIIVLYFKKGRKKPYKVHHSAMHCFCTLNLWLWEGNHLCYTGILLCAFKNLIQSLPCYSFYLTVFMNFAYFRSIFSYLISIMNCFVHPLSSSKSVKKKI